jgi:hypothetical protein
VSSERLSKETPLGFLKGKDRIESIPRGFRGRVFYSKERKRIFEIERKAETGNPGTVKREIFA